MSEYPTADDLPASLIECDQWVCWQSIDRDGKQTKVPIEPSSGQYASTTDESTWGTFEQARAYVLDTAAVAGLGFVFTDDDPFVGVDLDNCRDEAGNSPPWVTDIIDHLDSYTEISPSGTGYHVIVTGELPSGPNRRGDIECYETARYFTVTGDSIHEPPRPIAERTAALAAVHAEHVAPEETGDTVDATADEPQQAATAATLDDETVLEKARAASNGQKFARLWSGSTAGYESQSEADMALCFQLAFWTGGDSAQMDRLFRQSGLMRGKWDETHFADGSTYGERTVERAVSRVTDVYDPTGNEEDTTQPAAALPPTQVAEAQTKATATENTSHQLDRLHRIIDRLEARVESLEAENQDLRARLDERHERESNDEARTQTAGKSEDVSLWERMSTRLGRE